MPWYRTKCRVRKADSQLESLGIDDKDATFVWAQKALRTEDISSFEEISPSKLKVDMYDGKTYYVKAEYNTFFDNLEFLDYQLEFIRDEEEIKDEHIENDIS